MPNCNHEEADTRNVVHISHAGAKTIYVRAVDRDVVVILTGAFFDLIVTQPLTSIWVRGGMDKHYRFYHINATCSRLGDPQSRALPVFHAYSGCDTTSTFKGKSKKSAWQAWQAYKDVTATFIHMASHRFETLNVDSEPFQKI